MFALVDCNNFFVSCERVFCPRLKGKPVVVLSNNDGCVIARSNEAKVFGIKMGEPYFKAKELLDKHNITVFSSNYNLYGDLSQRVMSILIDSAPDIEIYSIDEAFLDLSHMDIDYEEFATTLRNKIHKWLGIPVSIGIAKTKTLAKLANNIAKKTPSLNGVLLLDNPLYIEKALKITKVGDIWGVGRAYEELLNRFGYETAHQLAEAPDQWVRSVMNITGLRLVHELRGTSCLELETMREPKKGIMTSRSFKTKLEKLEDINQALATYAKRAGEKLRKEGLTAKYIIISLETGFHAERTYNNSIGYELEKTTDYTPDLISTAKKLMAKIYREGYRYKKCGIYLTNLAPKSDVKRDLFDKTDLVKNTKLMKTIDKINKTMGKKTIMYASEDLTQALQGKSENKSDRFTDSWDEILRI